MIEAKKKYYRLYRGWYIGDGADGTSEWELYGVYTKVDQAWAQLRDSQERSYGQLLPLRICSVTAQADDDPAEFDPWDDDGDETFIDEKGCGLAEWTRLNQTGEVS